MTPQAALIELLGRVGASQGAAVLVNDEDLALWPMVAVAAMKTQGLLAKTKPAFSTICPGCERDCVMPVHIFPTKENLPARAFISCDKRSDISRVPVFFEKLNQWQCNIDFLCRFIATSLGLRRSNKQTASNDLRNIGIATNGKRSQMLCLQTNGELILIVGNNETPLTELIKYRNGSYSLESALIRQLMDTETITNIVHTSTLENQCAVFLAMKNLTADEVGITFVGDKAESGIGTNNLLEISARSETKRVALAEIGLIDLHRSSLNDQGVILLGMAQKKILPSTGPNRKKISRLRAVFRNHLGISDDPFYPYRKSVGCGWEPRFKINDNRGAADERARREAERRTMSYEQLMESGEKIGDSNLTHQSFDSENDAADDWLKKNDPDAPA